MSKHLLFLLTTLLATLPACQPSSPHETASSDEPLTVFRSVLDERPRMITLRLSDELWAAYSAETGALYRVWRDGVDFDGAVYTTAHGPQPTSIGPAYVVDNTRSPWQLLRDGQALTTSMQYKGHRMGNGSSTLMLQMKTPSGEMVDITETPAAVEDASGHAGLQRSFTASGIPEGDRLALTIRLNSLLEAESYSADGTFEVLEERDGELDGRLIFSSDGAAKFTSYFDRPAVQPAASGGDDVSKPAGLALIERSDCVACHNPDVQTVGPSYRAIAEKYPSDDLTIVRLSNKVIQGGSSEWGDAAMTPHPNLGIEDAKKMVSYILSMDPDDEAGGGALDVGSPSIPFTRASDDERGLTLNLFPVLEAPLTLDDIKKTDTPYYSGVVPGLHAPTEADMGPVQSNFYGEATGALVISETDNYVIRLVSDDGGRLYLDGDLLIDNDGLHGPDPRDAELILEAGAHPLRIVYFQAGGGASLSLQWARRGDDRFSVIPPDALASAQDDLQEAVEYDKNIGNDERRPGDQMALDAVHPSFEVETIRPDWFEPKVGGLDVAKDGSVYLSTWDPEGSVYRLTNIDPDDREAIEVTRIAKGLAEPLGLKLVDDNLYVMQKQELTRLVDTDGDGLIDRYETVANDWGATGNFHEFAFGLVFKAGYFYATLATAILPGGASANPQNPDRGSVIKIDPVTGSVEFIARGLRTPNGIALGVDDEIFVADNQGDWLPASKIVHIQEGEFYGSRSVDFEGTEGLKAKKPIVWLPQDEIGNSPSQPALLDIGPYENQLIHGEVTHGGIKRVFLEEVEGQYQGAVFRFTQGLEAGVNRLVWGPDGHLYIGGVGNPGNWGHAGKSAFGLQRMRYTGAPAFEMLAVRALADGFEIEFTEPLAEDAGSEVGDYSIQQWYYLPTANYGGPKLDPRTLPVRNIQVSDDRRRVQLTLEGLLPDHLVYFRLNDQTLRSEAGRTLWSTEAWYTLNQIPGAPMPSE